MTVWVVRVRQDGEFEQFAISSNAVGIDFGLHQSITEFQNRDALRQYRQDQSDADQLWRFAHGLQIGDIIVLPRRQTRMVAVGRITGDYRYDTMEQPPHIRSVEWDAIDIPRSDFDEDFLDYFGGLLAVFRINRDNAQERIRQIVSRHRGEIPDATTTLPMEVAGDDSTAIGVDEVIADHIIQRIRQRFTGLRLEYLVESILKARGYTMLATSRGTDVCFFGGKGQMGLGAPRLFVQVQSGTAPVDLPEYDRLQENVHSFHTDHGLLVSLSDFTRPVINKNESSLFQILLWGTEELAQNLLETYDALPPDIRADIPLVERKVLLETDV